MMRALKEAPRRGAHDGMHTHDRAHAFDAGRRRRGKVERGARPRAPRRPGPPARAVRSADQIIFIDQTTA